MDILYLKLKEKHVEKAAHLLHGMPVVAFPSPILESDQYLHYILRSQNPSEVESTDLGRFATLHSCSLFPQLAAPLFR